LKNGTCNTDSTMYLKKHYQVVYFCVMIIIITSSVADPGFDLGDGLKSNQCSLPCIKKGIPLNQYKISGNIIYLFTKYNYA